MKKDDFYHRVNCKDLVQFLTTHKTPCYIYNIGFIKQKIEALRHCLASRFSIHYAVKANPHPAILKTMMEANSGVDVASAGELEAALAAGIDPENIEFSGPGKTEQEIMYAIEQHAGSINAESLAELELLDKCSTRLDLPANVGIRINPDASLLKSGLRMSGATQFGIPENQVAPALRYIEAHTNRLQFTGYHVHLGSQVLDADSITNHITFILDMTIDLERMSPLKINKLNFGGGWGIPYFPHQSPLNLNAIAVELNKIFARPAYRKLAQRVKLILEPGRFLVAESGIYATTVLYRKRIRDKEYAVVDGGMHQNYVLAGGMGQIIKRNFELDILPASNNNKPGKLLFTIAGCLCTPQDILATDVTWSREVNPGDYVVFFNCGAYGISASPINFLSHPPPAEFFMA